MLLDSHTHVDMREFDEDRDQVIRRAHESGVAAIIDIGIDIASSEAAVALAEKYDYVYAAVGLHPHDASTITDAVMDRLEELAKHPKVAAIGETGLDFYRNRSSKEAQFEAFYRQLGLAYKLKLPVVVHSRNADEAVFDVLDEYVVKVKAPPFPGDEPKCQTHQMSGGCPGGCACGGESDARPIGVLHCFSGDAALGKKYIDMGFYISFAGPVTYPKSSASSVAREMPLDKMLIETDCPFLTPQAHRGKRNEPSYVSYVAAKIAEVKGITPEAVADATAANAIRLFRLPIEQVVER